jgi:methylglutamate dehydrogenase subunit C
VSTSGEGLRLTAGRVAFTFDGRRFEVQQGHTAASALLAQGVRLMGRSVKARRPRGVLTAGPEEPNALLSVGARGAAIPNVPASQLVLREGLELRSQNRWPSLRFDVAALLQAGGGFFGAGFYYKTFIWPSWHTYEPLIRRLAGLGEAPAAANLRPPGMEHLTCDVLVAGAGAAGLSAARAACRAGARVILCEREPAAGGELEFEDGAIEGRPALAWMRETVAELAARGARVLFETTVVAGAAPEAIAHTELDGLPGKNTLLKIRARSFVIAMGAVERPLVFIDNDRPGVMLLGAAERYLARYGVHVGRDLVICANHHRAYRAAARLRAAGMRIRAILDTRAAEIVRANAEVARLRDTLEDSGTLCAFEHAVLAAKGITAVTGAVVGPHAVAGRTRVIACDTILVSGGWTPAAHAAVQEGGSRRYVPEIGAFVAAEKGAGSLLAGAANGTLELGAVCAEGSAVGERAARAAGFAGSGETFGEARGDPAPALVPFWRAPAGRAAEKHQFVDFQNDVTVADLRTAVEEGFSDIEHAKRYTALGFGTDQGRLAGAAGSAILAELREMPVAEVGASRLRPPFHPVVMRSLAGWRTGDALRVTRRTPLHEWHTEHGGVLEASGLWMRPRFYRTNGDSAGAAAIAEATRVRVTGGIVDATTLGKIEITGPDAAAFLDFIYMTKASSLSIGRSRYVVSLREDGMVQDDGLLLRLSDERFRATTSTGHAAHMLSHLEFYRASAWRDRTLAITDVTEAWATIAVAGPKARTALTAIVDDDSASAIAGLRHMDFAYAQYSARELLVLRATFSGELGYEIHAPPDLAVVIWEALIAQGLAPYGLEALDILRVEKGYLTHAELSGQTTPMDLGMQAFMKRNDLYIGKELLGRSAFHESSRPRLVGLQAADRRSSFLAGAQIVTGTDRRHARGYVTSSAFSPALNEWIGLALLARDIPEGAEVIARDPVRNGETRVRAVSAVHFDPAGERMRS